MQVKMTRNPRFSPVHPNGEEDVFPDFIPGTIVEDVVSVRTCKDPDFRVIEVKSLALDGNFEYVVLPANSFVIQEGPGWQQYARHLEETALQIKAA